MQSFLGGDRQAIGANTQSAGATVVDADANLSVFVIGDKIEGVS